MFRFDDPYLFESFPYFVIIKENINIISGFNENKEKDYNNNFNLVSFISNMTRTLETCNNNNKEDSINECEYRNDKKD